MHLINSITFMMAHSVGFNILQIFALLLFRLLNPLKYHRSGCPSIFIINGVIGALVNFLQICGVLKQLNHINLTKEWHTTLVQTWMKFIAVAQHVFDIFTAFYSIFWMKQLGGPSFNPDQSSCELVGQKIVVCLCLIKAFLNRTSIKCAQIAEKQIVMHQSTEVDCLSID